MKYGNLLLNATEDLFPAHPPVKVEKCIKIIKELIFSRQEKSNIKNIMRKLCHFNSGTGLLSNNEILLVPPHPIP